MVINNSNNSTTSTVGIIGSSLITSDYYFNKPYSSFAPFLGGGFGTYTISNVTSTIVTGTTSSSLTNPLKEHKFGGLLRGGFEAGRFRLALEYYLVPNSTAVDINNTPIGKVGNSYVNLNLGFYLGGGKWKK